ncbi:MAG: hypothetical protein HWQ35_21665 [Nostoc sp. NMS1]|uniref:hypothetical protein n=1 Tax=unclassified Nostoc TaxID=2593658 RepID=UPI0025FF8FC8|nr:MULTISPECIES: hypothetical protein [unclassified Nostoc]MBN3909062.1 hypothetical protein [Nostoc sp. NMS1]MBN3992396.1 hypothetical protein [Nostoc sp. NMS2]
MRSDHVLVRCAGRQRTLPQKCWSSESDRLISFIAHRECWALYIKIIWTKIFTVIASEAISAASELLHSQ